MAITLPAFTPVEDSLFLTLYSRALDNRLSKPILSDATADEIVRNLDYDFEQFKVNKNFILNVALRAKKLDEVASGLFATIPTRWGSTWARGWTLAWSGSRRQPPSTGTTSTTRPWSPLESAWYPHTATLTTSAPTLRKPIG